MHSNNTEDIKNRKFYPKIVPPKDDFYIGMLLMQGAMCKDPILQQAAILLDNKDRLVAEAVNFLVKPVYGKKFFGWDLADRDVAVHFAEDAVLDIALKNYSPGSTFGEPLSLHVMYVSGPPNSFAVKRCVPLGIKKIVYGPLRSELFDESDWERSKKIATNCDMELTEFKGNLSWIRDRILTLEHLL